MYLIKVIDKINAYFGQYFKAPKDGTTADIRLAYRYTLKKALEICAKHNKASRISVSIFDENDVPD